MGDKGWLANLTATDIESAIPAYIAYAHGDMLTGYRPSIGTPVFDENTNVAKYPYNMRDAVVKSIIQNPYGDAYWRDSEEELEAMQNKLDEFKELIDAYNSTGDFSTFISTASSLFSTYGIDMSDEVADETNAYEALMDEGYQRAVAVLIGRAVAMNNVESTWFGIGLGNLATSKLLTIDSFANKLFMQAKRDKSFFLVEAAKMMIALRAAETDYFKTYMALSIDKEKLAAVARNDKVKNDFTYYLAETEWEKEQIKDFMQSLGGLNGAPQLAKQPSKLENAFAAAVSTGSSVGMSVGQVAKDPLLGAIAGVAGAGLAFFGNLL